MTNRERIELRLPSIKALTDTCNIDIDQIEFISGGKTNESYTVISETGEKYLVRIAGPGTEAFVDRKKEMFNVAAADRMGIAPKLLAAKDNNLLLEFIEGKI